jgi:hypothetical protein
MKLTGLFLLVALVLAAPGPAAWSAGGTGIAKARAKTLPTTAGPKPSAAVSSTDVTVTWAGSTFVEGGSVPGYRVRRYDALNVAQTVSADCSGSIVGVSCVEHGVPIGTWFYTVTPVAGSWETPSSESAKSDPAIVTL